MSLEILYDVCSLNVNIKRPIITFLENDNIVFHFATMSQCEKGGEVQIWDSAHEN
jgi:hypothetical protein